MKKKIKKPGTKAKKKAKVAASKKPKKARKTVTLRELTEQKILTDLSGLGKNYGPIRQRKKGSSDAVASGTSPSLRAKTLSTGRKSAPVQPARDDIGKRGQ